MNRVIAWMLLLGLGTSLVRAGSVDLQTPPARVPTTAPHLSSLLVDLHGKLISSKRSWLEQRAQLKERWQSFLGELPKTKVPLKTEALATEDLADFTRQLVRYRIEDGLYIDGYLLTPKPAQEKFPVVVVFHPTTPLQAKGVAELAPEYPEEKWLGVRLFRRGCVAWCPRNYIETAGADWAGNAARVLARHANWTGMMRMVWGAIRAADFVESLPSVDA